MKNPDVIDYVPARHSSGIAGRVVKLFSVLSVLMILGGMYRSTVPDSATMVDGATMVLVWYTGAFIFGAVAILTSATVWLRTGRPW